MTVRILKDQEFFDNIDNAVTITFIPSYEENIHRVLVWIRHRKPAVLVEKHGRKIEVCCIPTFMTMLKEMGYNGRFLLSEVTNAYKTKPSL